VHRSVGGGVRDQERVGDPHEAGPLDVLRTFQSAEADGVGQTETVVDGGRALSDWENWVERQIREGIERGEFDNLPGTGKPLPGLDGPHDDEWWVKAKLRREKASYLPPSLAVRRELEVALERIARATSDAAVRQIVTEINERIVHVNSHTTSGPPPTLMPLDVELVVQRWPRARRSA
jgi:hypothetical protein